MNLRECVVKSEYRTQRDNIPEEFYIPLLSRAVCYKRAVGYFSSSSLIEISIGIAGLVKNCGKIQIVASPYLSEEDIEAINEGYESREKIIEDALLRDLNFNNDYGEYEKKRLNLLANLIADGVLDIKIALMDNGYGMYHEKMGIIKDAEGNSVAFSGSMNESAPGMSTNYEAIDTFCSWDTEKLAERARQKEIAFNNIWNNIENGIQVLEFPSIKEEIIERYKIEKPDLDIDKKEFSESNYTMKESRDRSFGEKEIEKNRPRIPATISLYDYQKEAIENWAKANYRGIFDMATGTGKTFTGLAAICKLSQAIEDKLAVIIVCPFQHLVEQWVEDIVKFNIEPIIGYSSSPQKDWKKRLETAIRHQKITTRKRFFCFICTNATFSSLYVQKNILNIGSPILLLIDEAHNFGARSLSKNLDDRFEYRLALSATLERHNDEEGTAALFNFFGEKCIEYSLERAIQEKKLTPYRYYPVIVYLTPEELEEYRQISIEIASCLIKDSRGKYKLNKKGEILAIQRARIIAGATNKLNKLRELIEGYKDKYNILVYCGATNVVDENSDFLKVDDRDVRQIEAVISILGNEKGMLVSKFTSEETIEERARIKSKFETGNKLQALVAIKCLDEGVNIPGISTAFILASTTNPKEYIQRRGRVLRKAKGKEYAVIYDFVTLPRNLESVGSHSENELSGERKLIENEITRIVEFGHMALNPMDAEILVRKIKKQYHIKDEVGLEYE